MKNLTIKISAVSLVFTLMSCASTWDRLPDAATISLISVHTEKDIAMYKPVKNKEPVRVEESDDIQLGFSEMAALGKGLRGGLKSGIGAVKEVAGDRANAEMANAKHLSKYFMVELPSRVSSSIVSSGFENRQWADKTDEWINLVKLGKKFLVLLMLLYLELRESLEVGF